MTVKRNESILHNKAQIREYLGNISDYMFRKYIKMGMPALYDGRDWIAHKDNIDEFFRHVTRIQVKDGIDQIPDNS